MLVMEVPCIWFWGRKISSKEIKFPLTGTLGQMKSSCCRAAQPACFWETRRKKFTPVRLSSYLLTLDFGANVGNDNVSLTFIFSAPGFEEFMRDSSVREGEK